LIVTRVKIPVKHTRLFLSGLNPSQSDEEIEAIATHQPAPFFKIRNL
jgi:hypothetical protein